MGFVLSGRLKGVGQCHILKGAVAKLRYCRDVKEF